MDYTNKMKIIYDDGMLGLKGSNFHYLFGYERTGLESCLINGKEWITGVPQPTFWRATTDNDRGSKFNVSSAQWLAADYVNKCLKIDLTVDGRHFDELPIAPVTNQFSANETAHDVKIIYTYETVTTPSTTVDVTYQVLANGEMTVTAHYHGKPGLPELPVFGLRWTMPTLATEYVYEGLSGETYPDRMAGAVQGKFKVKGLPVTPYLVPQENGMHMQTKWVEITRNSTLNNADFDQHAFKLRFEQVNGDAFAFSCLPYTSMELENAAHHEELPPARRTVLTIAGAVRGVGGIDSWGSDVEPDYHIDATTDHQVAFKVIPEHLI